MSVPINSGLGRPKFVGRTHQLHNLLSTLDPAPRAMTASRLITGPPGVGKSRLAFELAHHAQQRGQKVVSARCLTAPHSPSYWPWTQIIREILKEPRALDLAALLLDDPLSATTFELFDSVVTCLRQAGERQQLVLVMEDLHALDPSSLSLLNYVSYALADTKVAIIGTARAAPQKLLKSFEAQIELTSFTREETAQYLGHWAGPHLDQVFAATGGLPLHLEHIVHGPAIAQEIDPGMVSEPLMSLLRTRLLDLPAAVLEAMQAVAVLEQAPVATLVGMLGWQPDHVDSALAQAVDLRFIEAPSIADPCTEFTHQIIADSVLSLTTPAHLAALHGAAAQQFASDPHSKVSYARHLVQAGPDFTAQAVTACRRAASQSLDQLAFEDGVELCQLALRVIPQGSDQFLDEQIQLSSLLASALWQVGDRTGALGSSQQAWDLSSSSANPNLRVAAALGPRFGLDFSGSLPQELTRRCMLVLDEQPDLSDYNRSRVLSCLAMAQITVAPTHAPATAQAALEAAHASGSRSALGYALVAQCATDLSPDTLFFRLTAAQRALAIAQDTNDRALIPSAWFLLLGSLLEQGDIQGIDRELAENSPLVTRYTELQDSRHSSWFRCLRAILDGDTLDAEQLLAHAFERAQAENDPDALTVWGAQYAVVRWIQGDLQSVEPVLRQAMQNFPDDPVWVAALAWHWTNSGRAIAAAGLITNIGPIDALHRDRNWLATLCILTEVAAHLEDLPLLETLREQLAPYAGRLVPIGLGVACWGTVDRPLALIALANGKRAAAVRHYEAAQVLCASTGAQVWLAQVQAELAQLLSIGTKAEIDRAAVLSAEANAAAIQMNWPDIALLSSAILDRVGRPAPNPAVASDSVASAPRPIIRVLGRFEVVSDQGTVRWTSKRARTLLKILVAYRGTPVSRARLLDILWPSVSHDFLANRFAVALTTVRRALDPTKALDLQHFVTFDGEYVSLNHTLLEIDVEKFLDLAHRGLSQNTHDELAAAIKLFAGEAFSDEFAAIWAEPLREEAQTVYLDAAHVLARMSEPARACDLYRSILALDEFDLAAHDGLTDALYALGAPRQAKVAKSRAKEILKELEE